MNDNIFETLKELSRKKDNQETKANSNYSKVRINADSKRKDPSYIYLDKDDQIKEILLSKLDSAGSTLINRANYKNPAKLIHDFMFGKY